MKPQTPEGALEDSYKLICVPVFGLLGCVRYICSMEQLLQQIAEYKKEIESFSAADSAAVEEFRIKWLGTKGLVKTIMGEMKNVPNEQKKEAGQKLNEFKQFTEAKFEELKQSANGSQ